MAFVLSTAVVPRNSQFAPAAHNAQLARRPPFLAPTTRCLRHAVVAAAADAKAAGVKKLEGALLDAVARLKEASSSGGIETYVKRQEEFAEALQCVEALEKTRSGFGTSAGSGGKLKALIVGRWNLVLTNSQAILKNSGSIMGLPGATCKGITVVLEESGKAETIEDISTMFNLVSGENKLMGKWRLAGKSGRSLEVTYANALLMGISKIRADSKAVLECSYCSDALRVGRSSANEVFVFTKDS